MPVLENVMNNFMQCTNMMFGRKVKYCITYKLNERMFNVYRRKFKHNFKVPVIQENLEGSQGLEIKSLNIILVTNIKEIIIYDLNDYTVKGSIPIKLLDSTTREPNEIVSIQKCQNEEYFAVISGKKLANTTTVLNQLFVYKRDRIGDKVFEFYKNVKLIGNPLFDLACVRFMFKDAPGLERDTLLFAKMDKIFEFNFNKGTDRTVYAFKEPIDLQPTMFVANQRDGLFMMSS